MRDREASNADGSLRALSLRLRDREVSPISIVEECLNQIERLNPIIKAFITVLSEQAINEATVAEAEIAGGRYRCPLHGVANNYEADNDVRKVFWTAVELIRGGCYPTLEVAAPLHHPVNDLRKIEADRESIVSEAFRDIDILLLPITTTGLPTVVEACKNSQMLSPGNTMFANYYRLPALSVPCGLDANGTPPGLQIVGRPWGETSVLQLGYRCESLELR